MQLYNSYDYVVIVTSTESLKKVQNLQLNSNKILVACIVPGIEIGQFQGHDSYDFYSIDEQQDFSQEYISAALPIILELLFHKGFCSFTLSICGCNDIIILVF